MRSIIIITCFLVSTNAFSQNSKNVYLLINQKDTLIEKQVYSYSNSFLVYTLINNERTVKTYERSLNIGGDDIENEMYEKIYFSFNIDDDTIVDKSYLEGIDKILSRKDFFKNMSTYDKNCKYYFIEPTDYNEFILRRVYPVILE